MSSRKKHIQDMTPQEIQFLQDELAKKREWNFHSHFEDAARNRTIKLEHVEILLTNYTIIEFHRRFKNNRILLRAHTPIRNRALCVVLQLNTNEIITGYWNSFDDHHTTLDESNYIKDLNILNFFK